MPVAHILPQLCLVGGAAATLLWALFTPRTWQWVGAVVALGSLAAASLTAWDLLDAPQQVTFEATWALDGAQLWATQLIVAITAVGVLLSPEWLTSDVRHGEYYTVLLLSALGASLLAGAADTLELVVGMLLASVTGYGLAAWHRGSALSVEAGIKYLLVGGLANVLLLLGVTLVYGLTAATAYDGVASALATDGPAGAGLATAVGLVAVGLALEMGAAPMHVWMPDVAQGAPVPSAAFLTVAPKVGALLALARFVTLLPEDAVAWRPLVAALAAATMTVGNLAALWQDDVRRLLGWSAVSQSGYALVAVVGIGSSVLAVPALLFFLAAYAAGNLAAFAVVAELRGRTVLGQYAGLARQRPLLAAALAVALLSLVGVPPLAGFAGKLALFATAIDAGFAWLAAVAVANTVLSLFYYLRVLAPVYLDQPSGAVPVLGRAAASAVAVTAVAVVAAGVVAQPLLDAFAGARIVP